MNENILFIIAITAKKIENNKTPHLIEEQYNTIYDCCKKANKLTK